MRDTDYRPATEEDLVELEEAAGLLHDFPAAFGATLVQARATKKLFQQWAKMGSLDLGLLNRVGGAETVLLAREINRIGKDL